jgi:hypothetical protein
VIKGKKVYFIILAVFAFMGYMLLAAQPIPQEIILTNSWLRRLETEPEDEAASKAPLIPFVLGNRFGYADDNGNLILNRVREKTISLSTGYWAEYDPVPQHITIHDPRSGEDINLEDPWGYPFFLKSRIFVISKDQTTLGELNTGGTLLWKYDYEAPLTCIDATEDYVLTGTLDGMIDLLDSRGRALFPSYAPGASEIPVILGCRISSDGSKLALVSGIDKQRFLFLEWYGENEYRVTHHEFLAGEGFRREVRMAFIDNDSRVVFEQEEGLGIYDIRSRSSITLPLSDKLEALDEDGGEGLFFFVTGGKNGEKRLIALKLPDKEILNVPFKSETSFLARRGKKLFIGGGITLAAFMLDKK